MEYADAELELFGYDASGPSVACRIRYACGTSEPCTVSHSKFGVFLALGNATVLCAPFRSIYSLGGSGAAKAKESIGNIFASLKRRDTRSQLLDGADAASRFHSLRRPKSPSPSDAADSPLSLSTPPVEPSCSLLTSSSSSPSPLLSLSTSGSPSVSPYSSSSSLPLPSTPHVAVTTLDFVAFTLLFDAASDCAALLNVLKLGGGSAAVGGDLKSPALVVSRTSASAKERKKKPPTKKFLSGIFSHQAPPGADSARAVRAHAPLDSSNNNISDSGSRSSRAVSTLGGSDYAAVAAVAGSSTPDGLYKAHVERLLVGSPRSYAGWVLTRLNSGGLLCKSYPSVLLVPSGLTTEALTLLAASFVDGRFPLFCWITDLGYSRVALFRAAGLRAGRLTAMDGFLDAVKSTTNNADVVVVALASSPSELHVPVAATVAVPASDAVADSYAELLATFAAEQRQRSAAPPGSAWTRHCRQWLDAAVQVADTLVRLAANTVVMCPTGVGASALVCCLVQLLVDPAARTLDGFLLLLHKELVAPGSLLDDARASSLAGGGLIVQLLDVVWQLWIRMPAAFEFDASLLVFVVHHRVSGRFVEFGADAAAPSFFAWVTAHRQRFVNPAFAAAAASDGDLVAFARSVLEQLAASPLLWHQLVFRSVTERSLRLARTDSDGDGDGDGEQPLLASIALPTFCVDASLVDARGTLELSGNRIAVLPPEHQTRWRSDDAVLSCRLRDNGTAVLAPGWCPAAAARFGCLTSVDLSDNALAALPADLGLLGGLTELAVERNRLASFPAFCPALTALRTLRLSSNHLSALPDDMGCPALEQLFVDGNALSALDLSALTGLRRLDAANNQLRCYPARLEHCAQLERLDLASNPLAIVPRRVHQRLERLRHVDLSRSASPLYPSFLLPAAGERCQLAELLLDSVRMSHVPPPLAACIVQRGASMTCRFSPTNFDSSLPRHAAVSTAQQAADLADDAAVGKWGIVRIAMLGDNRACLAVLSSLLASVSALAPERASSGYTKRQVRFDRVSVSPHLTLEFFCLMHSVDDLFFPRFFISSRCMAFVVFDPASDDWAHVAEYWTRQVHAAGFGSAHTNVVALLIVHHGPLSSDERQAIVHKIARTPSVMKIAYRYFVDLSTDAGQDAEPASVRPSAVAERIFDDVMKFAETLTPLYPLRYIRVGYLLVEASKSNAMIDWLQLSEMCASFGVDPLEPAFAGFVRFLCDCGQILLPERTLDSAPAQLIIILDRFWFHDLAVFAHRIPGEYGVDHAGVLASPQLQHMWRQLAKKYAVMASFGFDLGKSIVRLLDEFDVFFPLRRIDGQKPRFFVPSLLPALPRPVDVATMRELWPDEAPTGVQELEMRYQFRFYPLQLFSFVLARLQQIAQSYIAVQWRTGALIQSGAAESVFVEFNDSALLLRVRSRSTSLRRPLYWLVVEGVDLLLADYFSSMSNRVAQHVVCRHCLSQRADQPKLFSLLDCMRNWIDPAAYPLACGALVFEPGYMAPSWNLLSDVPALALDDDAERRWLGEGGFARVYLARLCDAQRTAVAVKQFACTTDASRVDELNAVELLAVQREIGIAYSFDHPNLIKVLGIARPLQMVMECAAGGDLHTWLTANGAAAQQDWPFVFKVAHDVACGLNYLHTLWTPVIHRDIRSPNVFLTAAGARRERLADLTLVHAKIGDFGLARFGDIKVRGSLETWQWLAPEVMDDHSRNYDERSDIYSLAMTLWECCAGSGRVPFEEHVQRYTIDGRFRLTQLRREIVTHGLRPTVPPATPPPLRAVIERCWSRTPERRLLAADVAELMRRLLLGLDTADLVGDQPSSSSSSSSSLPPSKSLSKYVASAPSSAGVLPPRASSPAVGAPARFRLLCERSLPADTLVLAASLSTDDDEQSADDNDGSQWLWLVVQDRAAVQPQQLLRYRLGGGGGGGEPLSLVAVVDGPGAAAAPSLLLPCGGGASLLVGCRDGSVYHYCPARGVAYLPPAHSDSIVCLLPLGARLLCADAGGCVTLWQRSDFALLHAQSLDRQVYAGCRLADCLWLACSDSLLRLRIDDAPQQLDPLRLVMTEPVVAMVAPPGAAAVWCLCRLNRITIYSPEGRLVDTLGPLPESSHALTCSGSNRVLVTAAARVIVCDAENHCVLQLIDVGPRPALVSFLRDATSPPAIYVVGQQALSVFARPAARRASARSSVSARTGVDRTFESMSFASGGGGGGDNDNDDNDNGSFDADAAKHSWKTATLYQPTWCAICGEFIWGVMKQGKRCRSCTAVVHHACAKTGTPCPLPVTDQAEPRDKLTHTCVEVDDQRQPIHQPAASQSTNSQSSNSQSSNGQSSSSFSQSSSTDQISSMQLNSGQHAWKTKTFRSPAWCATCGNFIWGAWKQGENCAVCKQPAHFHCSSSASSCDGGKRSLTDWNRLTKERRVGDGPHDDQPKDKRHKRRHGKK